MRNREAPSAPDLKRRIRVARGEEAGDLLLAGGRVVNVFTRRVEDANVVVADGWIAHIPSEGQAVVNTALVVSEASAIECAECT